MLSDILYHYGIGGKNMGDLISLDMEFFTEESYQKFLKQQSPLVNKKLRGKNETIFDALLSEEADFTKGPNANEIITTIRNYKGHK
jgi:hypothetical protein